MQSWDWSRLIANLFEQWADQPEVGTDFEMRYMAMHFCLELREDNHGYEKDGSTHHPEWERTAFHCLHFLITSRRQVFMAINQENTLESVPLSFWKNTSNHSSCWCSDGVESHVTRLMFKMWDHCWSHVPAEHQRLPKQAGVSVTLRSSWLSGPVFSFARVEHESVSRSDSYWRRLTKITPFKPVISFKEVEK